MKYDFSRQSTHELKRKLRFHLDDDRPVDADGECRRMNIIQQLNDELARRGKLEEVYGR